jgi:hypothetical protein
MGDHPQAGAVKRRLAALMRKYADRIDYEGAPKCTGWSFTFEPHEGIRFREDGHGCRLWYLGDADYARAHDEADSPAPRADWKALAAGKRGAHHG